MIIDPGSTPPSDVYRLMIGAIVPRPIAFVSTRSPEGILNLAPFSFFTAVSANPPVICFSSVAQALACVTASTQVNTWFHPWSHPVSARVDQFEASGLTPIPSDVVTPPRVKESRINVECRLVQVVHVSAKPLGGSLVLGEVVRFHIDDALFENYRIDPDKLRPVGRMGGPTYTRTTDRFNLEGPTRRKP
jgi:flavin reductase (DIM6/NTAB) family NADH-FMN oxidoreductase RutF